MNPLLAAVLSPPIPEARAWLGAYDGSHGPIIDLAQAVPGHAPPASLAARLGIAATTAEAARYGAILGDDGLRAAYAAHVSGLYGAPITAAEVAVTAGCNQAFFVAMIALARAGDAVLVPTPWYFNHAMTLDMLGIEARPLPTGSDTGFVPDPDAAERLIDAKVRAIVLVTPNNPTGAVIPAETIGRFADLATRHGIALVIDETYRDYLAPEALPPHRLFDRADWRERVIQLYSFSKAYAIPGHRLGAMIAGPAFLTEAEKVLDCMQICASRAGQIALAPALEDTIAWRAENQAEIGRRAAAFTETFAGLSHWTIQSIGAYFAYLRHPFRGVSGRTVAERLARERGVLALPGAFFGPGQDDYLRIAFANVGVEPIRSLAARLGGWTPEFQTRL
jgi:aspartate/methionine/tyrosine aminotransferase